jgi:hypothetical protein
MNMLVKLGVHKSKYSYTRVVSSECYVRAP